MERVEEMRIDQIPSASRRPKGATTVRRHAVASRISRRSFIHGTVMATSAVVLAQLGRLPAAFASHAGTQGYQIDPVTDGSHSSNCLQTTFYQSNHTCNVCGPSTSYSDVCVKVSHYIGYHRTGTVGGVIYTLRQDDCSHAGYDGWLWKTPSTACCTLCQGGSNCGGFKNATIRCHDGRRNGSKSICEWRTAGTSSGCPQPN